MNNIELLRHLLSSIYPTAKIELSKPNHRNGYWMMDFRLDDYFLVVDWRECDGFGLTADPSHGYGEGADEVYQATPSALLRIIKLVESRAETVPPYPVRIKELREKFGLSQSELATRMGIKQSAVSKLESRDDHRIDTIRMWAKAMGGELVVKFAYADKEELLFT